MLPWLSPTAWPAKITPRAAVPCTTSACRCTPRALAQSGTFTAYHNLEPVTRARACTHTNTHARTRTHTHTHTPPGDRTTGPVNFHPEFHKATGIPYYEHVVGTIW